MPEKKELRTKATTIRFTPSEYERIKQAKTERYIADYIRLCVLNPESLKDKADSAIQIQEIDPRLLVQISRIGNNLNQIAKRLNSIDDIALQVETAIILDLLHQTLNDLKRVKNAI